MEQRDCEANEAGDRSTSNRTLALAIAFITLGSLTPNFANELDKRVHPVAEGTKTILIACDADAARQCQQGANACYSRCGNGTEQGDLYQRCRDHCLSEYDSCKYVAGCR